MLSSARGRCRRPFVQHQCLQVHTPEPRGCLSTSGLLSAHCVRCTLLEQAATMELAFGSSKPLLWLRGPIGGDRSVLKGLAVPSTLFRLLSIHWICRSVTSTRSDRSDLTFHPSPLVFHGQPSPSPIIRFRAFNFTQATLPDQIIAPCESAYSRLRCRTQTNLRDSGFSPRTSGPSLRRKK